MRHSFQTNRYSNASQVKECINPLDFYSHEGQAVATRGKDSWKVAGICPFHADRHVGSFYIRIDNGAFRCFSCNAKGGDIITFIQKKYEMSFKEAIEKLKADWRLS
jgi:DNA primase